MIVQCPQCRKSYRLDDRFRDRASMTIKCPACRAIFKVEGEGAPERPAPEAAAQAVPEAGEPRSLPGRAAAGKVGKKILVADDSQYFRAMVGDILSQEGFDVVFAIDGEEVMTVFQGESPDLVILDLHMPKISGFEIIKEIRQGGVGKDVPILVVSSVFTGAGHVMALDSLGADEFIDKKFKPAYLVGKVRRLLGI